MTDVPWQPDAEAVRRVNDKVATVYQEHAAIAHEIMHRLHKRLDYLAIEPRQILDLGTGTGAYLPSLYKQFPKAAVTGVDISMSMLLQVGSRRSLFRPSQRVQADVCSLPFADESADLIIAGLLMFLVPDPLQAFREINRVLRPSGALLFSTLGPDSFRSVFEQLRKIVPDNEYLAFPDMHDVGDAMAASGLAQPVLDTEYLAVTYPTAQALLQELRACGGINVAKGRRRGLMAAQVPHALVDGLSEDERVSTELEIIQGHAWKGIDKVGIKDTGVSFPERYIPVVPDLSN